IHPATAANRPHIFGFGTARTASNDPIFELWSGATVASRVFWVDKDGDLTLSGGVISAGTVRVQGGGTIRSGTGDPENVVTGSVGDLFLRTDGGSGTTLYVKESGTGTNTGW